MKRRPTTTVGATPEEMVGAFRWSRCPGDGTSHMLGGWHFRSEAHASAGWQQVRRPVWGACNRFSIPRAARFFDGLSFDAVDVLRRVWSQQVFPLQEVLEVVADDRRALERFARTPAAKTITDYLHVMAADLNTVERVARELADWDAGAWWRRPYPNAINTAARYGADSPERTAA